MSNNNDPKKVDEVAPSLVLFDIDKNNDDEDPGT